MLQKKVANTATFFCYICTSSEARVDNKRVCIISFTMDRQTGYDSSRMTIYYVWVYAGKY